MKFTIGSETDSAHSVALKHEFLRCEIAFNEFAKIGSASILMAQLQKQDGEQILTNKGRIVACKMYDAHARFVHHLYEFLLGAMIRERGNTAQIRAEDANRWIQANAQRVLTGRRLAIVNGTAPSWENDISSFPEHVPPEFAKEFRAIRNKAIGHVTHERASMSLTDFYEKYHQLLYMVYWNCLGFWGVHKSDVFPDLQEITEFSVLIFKSTPVSPTEPVDEEARELRRKAIMDDIWRLT